jgi:hypothetical protein
MLLKKEMNNNSGNLLVLVDTSISKNSYWFDGTLSKIFKSVSVEDFF